MATDMATNMTLKTDKASVTLNGTATDTANGSATETATDMSPFLNPALCANTDRVVDGKVSPCRNAATLVCTSCKLVQYCSKECQKADWRSHKSVCKSELNKVVYTPRWIQQNRRPAFTTEYGGGQMSAFGGQYYLWGNVPALDVLNLKDNEGVNDVERDFHLLFAASGDLRNVIKSVVGLPDGYKGQCTVTINDKAFTIVARNVILLLVALHFEPETAVPIMIHLWYSALLPAKMLESLQRSILPYVEDVCKKIWTKKEGVFQAKTFIIGDSSVRVILSKEQWFELKDFFKVPPGLTKQKADFIRRQTTEARERIDYVDRAVYLQPKGKRAGIMRFRHTGILLPYGASQKDFDTPNPTIFLQDKHMWPMKDDADPLGGWAYGDALKYMTADDNDVYGGLFYYIRELLLRFCNIIKNGKVAFRLFCHDATELRGRLGKSGDDDMLFDRIEVSNISDRGYVGPEKILSTFGPLLKPKDQSPKATLLMLFLNVIGEETQMRTGGPTKQDTQISMDQLSPFIKIENTIMPKSSPSMSPLTNPIMMKIASCLIFLGDFDKHFDTFLDKVRMKQRAEKAGLMIKGSHSIIKPWPFRLTKRSTQEEFDEHCCVSVTGQERYMEFGKL